MRHARTVTLTDERGELVLLAVKLMLVPDLFRLNFRHYDGVKLAVFGGGGLENRYHGGDHVRR